MSSLISDPAVTSPPAPPAGAPPRPAGPVRPSSLNLARRPFANSRPVVRAALALWLLGVLLLLGNVYLFWNYMTGSADKRTEIDRREGAVAREQQVVRDLEARFDNMDLEQQNAQIDFLNRKIADRTFSWSLLFDRLAAVMPNDVRIRRLTPVTSAQQEERLRSLGQSQGARRKVAEGQVLLSITAQSKSDEALSDFVNNLFRDPFRDPNVSREVRDEETDIVEFELTVTYLPQSLSGPAAGETPVVVEEEAAAAPALPGGTPQ